jgi:twitching motility protein PilU
VGVDTLSYADALKNTLRQAPDVILIGEIRDRETMEHALAFAETGHLAISTLHANSANQALDRIINFFPEERRPQLLTDLSANLRAFVSQRLIPTVDGKRVAAIEILLHSPMVETLIKRGEVSGLKEIMEKSTGLGMQTFDQALFELHQAGKISFEEAIKNADSANNLRLRINLSGGAPSAEKPGGIGVIAGSDGGTGGGREACAAGSEPTHSAASGWRLGVAAVDSSDPILKVPICWVGD